MNARLVIAMFGLLAGACSSDPPAPKTTSSSADAGLVILGAAECTSRCGAVATRCGATAAVCSQPCAQSITATQASCLESKSCAELIALATQGIQSVCPGSIALTADGGFTPPTSLFIGAPLPPGLAPVRGEANGKIVSSLDLSAKPAFAPTLPEHELPNIAQAYERVTVASPDAGACALTFSFSLNATTVRVRIDGADDGAAGECAAFMDKAASQGVALTLTDVTWLDSETKSLVTIALK